MLFLPNDITSAVKDFKNIVINGKRNTIVTNNYCKVLRRHSKAKTGANYTRFNKHKCAYQRHRYGK